MLDPRRLMPLALVAATLVANYASAATPKVDGWFPCSEYTFQDELPETTASSAAASGSSSSASSPSSLLEAECATFKAPLCYDGVCNDPSNQQIDVFVKRIAATDAGKPNIFFMQGGPGAASTAMESAMTGVYALLSGAVNVYTMDHRGTGRSTKLDCVAAQALTSGSPGGTSIDATEVASCAADLASKYGTDIAAFSVTSAASDLNLFISSFLNDSQTFVYGVSYGSSLVERLMHLNTTGIVGYVLDGISTTSGGKTDEFEYFSTWDIDYDEVGQHFLSFCAENNADCGKYFRGSTLSDALRTLTTNLDSPSYKCSSPADEMLAGLYGYQTGTSSPALALRSFMGAMLADATLRTLIPVVTYRLTRCNDDDVKVLSHLFKKYAAYSSQTFEDSAFESELVYNIIVFSEFWETPTPSTDQLLARFTNTTISSGTYGQAETYCVFSKEDSAGCKDFVKEANYTAAALTYAKDEYWNKAAKPPSDVSVLLMSSKMDPQTPHKYAERLYSALDTTNKELVVFEQATHGTLWSTPLSNTDPEAPICGMMIVASYVAVGGDLSKMNKSCVAKMPAVSFHVEDVLVHNWLNTTSAVDGTFTGTTASAAISDSSGASSETSYKTAFIVFLVLFIVTLLAAAAFLVKWRKATKTGPIMNAQVMTPEVQA